MRAPLVPITVAFTLGILWGAHSHAPPLVLSGTCVLSGVFALARARGGTFQWPSHLSFLLVFWLSLGMLRAHIWRAHPDERLPAALTSELQPVRLHGIVTSDPVQPFEPQERDPQVCVVRLLHVGTAQGWRPITGRARAALSDPITPVAYGDEVLVEGDWSRVPPPGNPGQYDWQAALARQRIHALLRVKPFHGLAVLRHDRGNPWLAAIFRLRQRWERLIRARFTDEEAGVLLSLLLGQRVALDDALKDAFVETGTVHLLVISGFNVGLIAALLELFFRLAGVPWRVRLLLLALSLGAYAILTGLQPPVVRATLMAWIVLGARALDRALSWFNILAAAALVMVWIDPAQLFDPGFQLSFGAVLSLLVFTGRWQAWLDGRLGWVRPGWLRRYLCLSMAATSAVWVGLSPILAWYFHLVSPVSMLANLIVAPLMSALVGVGTTVLMLAMVFEGAVGWSHGILALLLAATLRGVSWCHAIPGGFWFVGHPAPLFLLGYYGLLSLSVIRVRLGWSHGYALSLWLAGLAIWVWGLLARQWMESRWLRVDVLDVGHGDSLVVRTPDGQVLLVDAGSQEAGRFQVVPFLRYEGITALDGVVLTHADEDHLGGAIPVLEHIRVRRLLTNGVFGDTMSARRVRSLAAHHGVEESILAAGMSVARGQGLVIEVLHPPRGLVPGTVPKSNDNSVVLKVTKGSAHLLLSGDIEEGGLPWLLQRAPSLRSTVLKVPHHGSRLGSVGERFFDAVRPEVAILSVGRIHHLPAVETLAALRRAGATLYTTRDDGAISLRTDGIRLELRTFKGSRTWQSVDFVRQ